MKLYTRERNRGQNMLHRNLTDFLKNTWIRVDHGPGVALGASLSVRASAAAGVVSAFSADAPAFAVKLSRRTRWPVAPAVGGLDQTCGARRSATSFTTLYSGGIRSHDQSPRWLAETILQCRSRREAEVWLFFIFKFVNFWFCMTKNILKSQIIV
jgi:hypothetical protein